MKTILTNIGKAVGIFAAVLAILLGATFVSELAQPRVAEGWEQPAAKVTVTGCGVLELVVTNREEGFPGSPGTPKITSIFPSSVTVTSPFSPAVLENTGDAEAVAILAAPIDLDSDVTIEGKISYSGSDGSDTKYWEATTRHTPCPPETTTTTSTSTTSTTQPTTTTTSTTQPTTTTTSTTQPTTTTSTTQPSTTTSTTQPSTTTTSTTQPTTTSTSTTQPSTTTTSTPCEEQTDERACLIPPVVIEAPPAAPVPVTPAFTG